LHGVLRYLVENDVQLGIRLREGPDKGTREWRRPNRMTLQTLLHNPAYAGIYAYGRRRVDPRRQDPARPSTGRVVRSRDGWHVVIPNVLPAYITVAQFESNEAKLAANRARADAMGAVRGGPALAAGLVHCGRCNRRMSVRHHTQHSKGELVGETLRAALEELAEAAPAWLTPLIEPEWAKRYGRRVEIGKLPGGKPAVTARPASPRFLAAVGSLAVVGHRHGLHRGAEGEGALMEAEGVHHSYGVRRVLRGVDVTLPAGSVVGIVGENGAGKSTLLKILSGELRPDRGVVRHGGRFGYCPQQVVLNDVFTVRQHLEFFAAAYDVADLRRAEEVMAILGFAQYAGALVGALSGGTRQKLNLTLAVMHDPQVLLLDEPYQGFDWETYLRFWDLVGDLRAAGRSVLVVSHLAYDTDRLDQVWRLRDGALHGRQEDVR
jgi:ABC-type Mn2+/Zn2+ transport system ATPase subunit